MSRLLYGVAAAAVVGGLGWFFLQSTKPVAQSKIQQADFSEWYSYRAPKGEFKVFFPRIPQNATATIRDGSTREPAILSTYYALDNQGVLYLINSTVFTDPDSKEEPNVIENTIQNLVRSQPQNQLLEKGEGKLHEEKTTDFVIQNNRSRIFGRALKKGKHLYLLTMTTEEGQGDPKSFSFFTNSFEPLTSEEK